MVQYGRKTWDYLVTTFWNDGWNSIYNGVVEGVLKHKCALFQLYFHNRIGLDFFSIEE